MEAFRKWSPWSRKKKKVGTMPPLEAPDTKVSPKTPHSPLASEPMSPAGPSPSSVTPLPSLRARPPLAEIRHKFQRKGRNKTPTASPKQSSAPIAGSVIAYSPASHQHHSLATDHSILDSSSEDDVPSGSPAVRPSNLPPLRFRGGRVDSGSRRCESISGHPGLGVSRGMSPTSTLSPSTSRSPLLETSMPEYSTVPLTPPGAGMDRRCGSALGLSCERSPLPAVVPALPTRDVVNGGLRAAEARSSTRDWRKRTSRRIITLRQRVFEVEAALKVAAVVKRLQQGDDSPLLLRRLARVRTIAKDEEGATALAGLPNAVAHLITLARGDLTGSQPVAAFALRVLEQAMRHDVLRARLERRGVVDAANDVLKNAGADPFARRVSCRMLSALYVAKLPEWSRVWIPLLDIVTSAHATRCRGLVGDACAFLTKLASENTSPVQRRVRAMGMPAFVAALDRACWTDRGGGGASPCVSVAAAASELLMTLIGSPNAQEELIGARVLDMLFLLVQALSRRRIDADATAALGPAVTLLGILTPVLVERPREEECNLGPTMAAIAAVLARCASEDLQQACLGALGSMLNAVPSEPSASATGEEVLWSPPVLAALCVCLEPTAATAVITDTLELAERIVERRAGLDASTASLRELNALLQSVASVAQRSTAPATRAAAVRVVRPLASHATLRAGLARVGFDDRLLSC